MRAFKALQFSKLNETEMRDKNHQTQSSATHER